MVGALPYTCIAVYAGMVISSIEDINSMFSHTSTLWYCIYAVLGVICLISFVALIKYTAAEMKAAVAAAPRLSTGPDDDGLRGDGEADFGELPGDATLFGTFTSRDGVGVGVRVGGVGVGGVGVGGDTGDEEMQTFGDGDGDGVSNIAPLLGGGEAHRRSDAAGGGGGARGGGGGGGGGRKPSSIVDV